MTHFIKTKLVFASEILIEEGHSLSKNIEPIFKKIEKEDIDRQKESFDSSNSSSI